MDIIKLVRCYICRCELRNDIYGERCEDCYADNAGNVPRDQRGRPSTAKPLPLEKPKKPKKPKLVIGASKS